jgi:phage-related protein
MSYKPTTQEVKEAIGIIAGTVKSTYSDGRWFDVTEIDREDAIDLIVKILKDGWNV